MRVGFIGLGKMGAPIAANIKAAGHEVRVWNRTAGKATALAADGATPVASPAEAVDGADVLLTMLFDGPAVLDAVRRAEPNLHAGMVWAQCTTVGLDSITELAEFAALHEIELHLIVGSILAVTEAPNAAAPFSYPAGTWGPEEAEDLVALDARAWRRL